MSPVAFGIVFSCRSNSRFASRSDADSMLDPLYPGCSEHRSSYHPVRSKSSAQNRPFLQTGPSLLLERRDALTAALAGHQRRPIRLRIFLSWRFPQSPQSECRMVDHVGSDCWRLLSIMNLELLSCVPQPGSAQSNPQSTDRSYRRTPYRINLQG